MWEKLDKIKRPHMRRNSSTPLSSLAQLVVLCLTSLLELALRNIQSRYHGRWFKNMSTCNNKIETEIIAFNIKSKLKMTYRPFDAPPLRLTSIPAQETSQFKSRRETSWGWADKGPGFLPAVPRSWRKPAGGQSSTWATTLKETRETLSVARVFRYAQWRKDWVKVSGGLALGA